MTMFMYNDFKVIAITNRNLSSRPLPEQINHLCTLGIKDFILREKDLSLKEYTNLAAAVAKVCEKNNANLILHTYWQTASELNALPNMEMKLDKIHFPLWLFERDHKQIMNLGFKEIGCSCHSYDQAKLAVSLGATYITASHIYETNCKKDLPPKGLDFLKNICDSISIPVYGLGGIKQDGSQFQQLQNAGAKGACIMSGLMKL